MDHLERTANNFRQEVSVVFFRMLVSFLSGEEMGQLYLIHRLHFLFRWSLFHIFPPFFLFDAVVKVVDFVVSRGNIGRYKNYCHSVYSKLDRKLNRILVVWTLIGKQRLFQRIRALFD